MFHKLNGEMNITLDDVPALVGLSVTGSYVNSPSLRFSDAKDVVVNLLGVSSQEAHDELTVVWGQSIRLKGFVTRGAVR